MMFHFVWVVWLYWFNTTSFWLILFDLFILLHVWLCSILFYLASFCMFDVSLRNYLYDVSFCFSCLFVFQCCWILRNFVPYFYFVSCVILFCFFLFGCILFYLAIFILFHFVSVVYLCFNVISFWFILFHLFICFICYVVLFCSMWFHFVSSCFILLYYLYYVSFCFSCLILLSWFYYVSFCFNCLALL